MNNNRSDRKFLQYLSECTSTNDYMKELVQAAGAVEGTAVYTDNQTAGKGQHGRRWHDAPQSSLALSILLKPVQWPHHWQFALNKLIVAAVHQSLADFAGPLTIKWPNDIFYQDRKLSGMLIENSWMGKNWEYAIVGVGVNVYGHDLPPFRPEAVSLETISPARPPDIGKLASEIAVNIMNWYRNKDLSDVAAYYHKHLYGRGVYRSFITGKGYFAAAIKEVTDDGRMVLFESDGEQSSFEHGKVQFCF